MKNFNLQAKVLKHLQKILFQKILQRFQFR